MKTAAPAPRVVIIVGPYRSGTSLTARVIAALGAYSGPEAELIPANDLNPTGYRERNDVNSANHALITSAGGSLERPGSPEHIAQHGQLGLLRTLDLKWMARAPLALLKDPRMCATLLAWFRSGLINAATCRVIHVKRDLDATALSAQLHGTVAGYCDGDPARIRAMLHTYAELAQWHVDQAPYPTLSLDYAELVADPRATTARIANFLGITSTRKIKRAAALVGKDKARRRLAWRDRWVRLRIRLGGIKKRLLSPFRR